jgi:hypothetical protein
MCHHLKHHPWTSLLSDRLASTDWPWTPVESWHSIQIAATLGCRTYIWINGELQGVVTDRPYELLSELQQWTRTLPGFGTCVTVTITHEPSLAAIHINGTTGRFLHLVWRVCPHSLLPIDDLKQISVIEVLQLEQDRVGCTTRSVKAHQPSIAQAVAVISFHLNQLGPLDSRSHNLLCWCARGQTWPTPAQWRQQLATVLSNATELANWSPGAVDDYMQPAVPTPTVDCKYDQGEESCRTHWYRQLQHLVR